MNLECGIYFVLPLMYCAKADALDLFLHKFVSTVLSLSLYLPLFIVDGSFLYCAPNTGRHGMEGLEVALNRVGIVAVEKFAAPEE